VYAIYSGTKLTKLEDLKRLCRCPRPSARGSVLSQARVIQGAAQGLRPGIWPANCTYTVRDSEAVPAGSDTGHNW